MGSWCRVIITNNQSGKKGEAIGDILERDVLFGGNNLRGTFLGRIVKARVIVLQTDQVGELNSCRNVVEWFFQLFRSGSPTLMHPY